MKKLLLLSLTAVIIAGCINTVAETHPEKEVTEITLYGCEYIKSKVASGSTWNFYVYTHKGNCKYCAGRRKQEIRELIKELKMK